MGRLSFSLATILLVTACSSGLDIPDVSEITDEVSNLTQPDAQTPGAPFVSPATLSTETAFTDTFVSNNTINIPWAGPAVNSATSIDYIAQAFNIGRAADPTVNEKLRMPQQADWDSYNTSQKIIYLINSERSARGMRPFRGIAPELVTSSGLYATELSENGQFSHTYGTHATTTARLADWANVIAPPQTAAPIGNENTTYNTYYIEEMIAYVEAASNATIYEPEARAIYRFMYRDKTPTHAAPYTHRNIILTKKPASAIAATALLPAGTINNAQPIIGASTVEAMVSGNKRNTLVIHGIDPNANWDLSNMTAAPGLIGPESADDCLRGSFVEANDGAGNNSSTCEQ